MEIALTVVVLVDVIGVEEDFKKNIDPKLKFGVLSKSYLPKW